MSSENTSLPPPPPINTAPIGPGNHDRAWNDPPMFSTEVNVSARPPPNKLNKRVAHPISSASAPPAVLAQGSGLPGLPGVNPLMPPAVTSGPPQHQFYSPPQ